MVVGVGNTVVVAGIWAIRVDANIMTAPDQLERHIDDAAFAASERLLLSRTAVKWNSVVIDCDFH
jgi:hypothetical protein